MSSSSSSSTRTPLPPLPRRRRPIVGVMGSGSASHESLATPLGQLLARLGVHLLTGGGRGVMEAVSRAFYSTVGREGQVIGIIPGEPQPDGTVGPKSGYPNPYVEIAINTHLPASGVQGQGSNSRNSINILTSDVIIALPGSAGTTSEVKLALRFGKPVVLYLGGEGEKPAQVIEGLEEAEGEGGQASSTPGKRPPRARSLEEVEAFIRPYLPESLRLKEG